MTYYGAENDGNFPTISDDKDTTPAYYVSWVEAIIYCNRRSEEEGFEPVYSMDGNTDVSTWTTFDVKRDSNNKYYYDSEAYNGPWDLENENIYTDFGASGYRLPTVAEYKYIFTQDPPKLSNTSYNEWCHNNFTDSQRVYYYKDSGSVPVHFPMIWHFFLLFLFVLPLSEDWRQLLLFLPSVTVDYLGRCQYLLPAGPALVLCRQADQQMDELLPIRYRCSPNLITSH